MLGYVMDKWQLFLAKLSKVHTSFHIWFNGTVGTIVVLLPFLQDQFPQMQPYMTETTFRWAMGIIVLANIMARFYITKCLSKK